MRVIVLWTRRAAKLKLVDGNDGEDLLRNGTRRPTRSNDIACRLTITFLVENVKSLADCRRRLAGSQSDRASR